MSFASVYPHYIAKAEKKGRTKAEVDEIIIWLTGYNAEKLQEIIDNKIDFETFFAEASLNPNVSNLLLQKTEQTQSSRKRALSKIWI